MRKKQRIIAVASASLLLMLAPGWLYASGNLPYFPPRDEDFMVRFNDACPALAGLAYDVSHGTFETLRGVGVDLPDTHNERLMRILQQDKRIRETKQKVVAICNSMLRDS